MQKQNSLAQFLRKYHNDNACLNELFKLRYPNGVFCKNCKKVTRFTKITNRPVYQCSCGYQVSPLANTIFHKSTTPLQYWFYVMFVMTNTRSGVSAKSIQREIGVSYETAWRMCKQVRILMGKRDGGLLKGTVEVDESFFGGAGKNRRYVANYNEKPKDVIMGMVERGGKVVMKKIETTGKSILVDQIQRHIDPSAKIMHDEFVGYKNLHKYGYDHQAVNHGKHFVRNKVVHTENLEGLWGRIKPSAKGVYRKMSSKYIESYMNEYCFRYNHRTKAAQMFDILLAQAASTAIAK